MDEGTVLEPLYILDQKWRTIDYIGPQSKSFGRKDLSEDEKQVMSWIRSTRIGIAPVAQATVIGQQDDYDHILVKMGMNIILPKGSINELRFKATLKGDGETSEKVYAIDGFPNDTVNDKHILKGQVSIGVTKLMKFIPAIGMIGEALPDLTLGPWTFAIGKLRNVYIDFSGERTPIPEWYFKADGIKNELEINITVAKHKTIKNVVGDVNCAWIYDPGLLGHIKLGTDNKPVPIYTGK